MRERARSLWHRVTRRYEAVYVVRNPGKWHRTECPHDLVTFDYDIDGVLIGVEIIGKNMKAELS